MGHIENTSPNSSSIVASHSYWHGLCREHGFPITPLLHVTKLLSNNMGNCRSAVAVSVKRKNVPILSKSALLSLQCLNMRLLWPAQAKYIFLSTVLEKRLIYIIYHIIHSANLDFWAKIDWCEDVVGDKFCYSSFLHISKMGMITVLLDLGLNGTSGMYNTQHFLQVVSLGSNRLLPMFVKLLEALLETILQYACKWFCHFCSDFLNVSKTLSFQNNFNSQKQEGVR
jgi:hypothetical protein